MPSSTPREPLHRGSSRGTTTVFLTLLLVLLALARPSTVAAKPDTVFHLGGLFSVTGSAPGLQRAAAALLAADFINADESFPFNITLTIGNDGAVAVNAANLVARFVAGAPVASTTALAGASLLANQCAASSAPAQSPSALSATVGIVGSASSSVSQAAALVGTLYDQPQVSYSSTSVEFRDRRNYPRFCRVVPSDSAQVQALVGLAIEFQWARVVTLSTTDLYGSSFTTEFVTASRSAGLSVTQSLSFRTGDGLSVAAGGTDGANIEQALRAIRATKSRVILMFVLVADAQHVLRVAARLGMVGGATEYVFVGIDGWMVPELLAPAAANEISAATAAEMHDWARGAVGTRPRANTDAFSAILDPKRAELQTRMAALGFANRLANITLNPTNPYASFAFDAVYTYAHALRSLIAADATASGTGPAAAAAAAVLGANGTALFLAIRNTSFTGVTGAIAFDATTCSRIGNYEVLNVRAVNASAAASSSQVSVMSIGVYDGASGNVTFSLATVWPLGVRTAVPSDWFRPVTTLSSTAESVAIYLLIGLCLFSFWCHFEVHRLRREKHMRASSPRMQHLLISGSFVGYAASAVSMLSTSHVFVNCHLTALLLLLSADLIFGALLARSYRIHRVFSVKNLQMQVLKDHHLVAFIAALMIYDVAAVLIYWGASPATHVLAVDFANPDADVVICHYAYIVPYLIAIFLPKLLLLGAALAIAWLTRAVMYNFNESKTIGVAVWTSAFVFTCSIIVWISVRRYTLVQHYVLAIGIAVAMVTVLCVVVVPRVLFVHAARRRLHERGIATSGDEEKARLSGGSQRLSLRRLENNDKLCANCGGPTERRSIIGMGSRGSLSQSREDELAAAAAERAEEEAEVDEALAAMGDEHALASARHSSAGLIPPGVSGIFNDGGVVVDEVALTATSARAAARAANGGGAGGSP